MEHTKEELEAAKEKHEEAKYSRDDTAALIKHLVDKKVLVESELPARLKRKLK
tara:strand:- start:59 stop:217 length:159 start_codon:yes stop_codon:yes gene_type:complete